MAVIATASMSLDGFVAYADDSVGPLFDWFEVGEVEIAPGDTERQFHLTESSADHLASSWQRIGAEVVGRHLFDITDGWRGRPPAGGGFVVVVTHAPPTDWAFTDTAPFEFVDGLESAVARAVQLADGGDVSITGGNLTGQALAAGLVDELRIELVPVILGGGVSFFGGYAGASILLENPQIVESDRVTHMHYRVRR